jgi:hypothetical protein
MVDHMCCTAVNASCAFYTKPCRRNTVNIVHVVGVIKEVFDRQHVDILLKNELGPKMPV